jgi:hypothetical protein
VHDHGQPARQGHDGISSRSVIGRHLGHREQKRWFL